MNNQHKPALGIMKTSEYPDAVSFRVACDCHDNSHDVDVWIEVERDDEVHEISITFYRELDTPFWEASFNRFREAWQILWHGRSRFSGSLILRAETADRLCEAIQTSVRRLQQKKQ